MGGLGEPLQSNARDRGDVGARWLQADSSLQIGKLSPDLRVGYLTLTAGFRRSNFGEKDTGVRNAAGTLD